MVRRSESEVIQDSTDELLCDACGSHICWSIQFDLEGSYFVCDLCRGKHMEEQLKTVKEHLGIQSEDATHDEVLKQLINKHGRFMSNVIGEFKMLQKEKKDA